MIEIINNYDNLRKNISYYIDISGYKNTFLAEQLEIGKVAFSRRKSVNDFTFDQIKKLSKFIFAQEIIEKDELLSQLISKGKNEIRGGKTIPNSEIKRTINA